MEREHRRLTGAVIDQSRHGDEARCAGDGDDLAFLLSDHVRQERLDGVKIAEEVDAEELLQVLGRRLEDGVGMGDTSVVDEDGYRTQRRSYFIGDGSHG